MSYPDANRYSKSATYGKEEEKSIGFKSDSIKFVEPKEFPAYMGTHILCIVEHKGALQASKYFIKLEVYSAIMENFTQ